MLDEVATAAALGMRERLLYAFDATSPMEAAASFRARHTRARMQMECDEMQGAAMALEDEAAAVTNWWLKSHRGHLLSAAAVKGQMQPLPAGFRPSDPHRELTRGFCALRLT